MVEVPAEPQAPSEKVRLDLFHPLLLLTLPSSCLTQIWDENMRTDSQGLYSTKLMDK